MPVSVMGLPRRSQPAATQEEEATVGKGSKGMIWGKEEIKREGEDAKILLKGLAPQSFLV